MRLVVVPRYDPTATTQLVPMGRAEAVRELAAYSIGYGERMRMLLEAVNAVRAMVGAPA